MSNEVYELLKIKELKTDKYQDGRLNPARAKKIANNWDEKKFVPIIVSYRDGIYWIVDGMHRTSAKKIKFGSDALIMCKILTGLTFEQEALLFAHQDDGERTLSSIIKFNALILGKDETALKIKDILEEHNFVIAKSDYKKDYQIVAVGSVQYIYEKTSPIMFAEVFRLIKDTWDGSSNALDGGFIKGVYSFVNTYYSSGYDHKRFIKSHEKVSAIKIKNDGDGDKTFKDGFTRYGIQMWKNYNSGIREENKLPFKFTGKY
jgi:hypothetical protein